MSLYKCHSSRFQSVIFHECEWLTVWWNRHWSSHSIFCIVSDISSIFASEQVHDFIEDFLKQLQLSRLSPTQKVLSWMINDSIVFQIVNHQQQRNSFNASYLRMFYQVLSALLSDSASSLWFSNHLFRSHWNLKYFLKTVFRFMK